jgi:hypothetical protein
VQVFDENGDLLTIWPTELIGPAFFYVDDEDIVYIPSATPAWSASSLSTVSSFMSSSQGEWSRVRRSSNMGGNSASDHEGARQPAPPC